MKNVNGSHLIYGKQLKTKYQIKSFFLVLFFYGLTEGKIYGIRAGIAAFASIRCIQVR